MFEQLSTDSFNQNYIPTIIPKSLKNYVSAKVGFLRFLDSYRFLSSSLQKPIASLDTIKYMDSDVLIDDSFKKKLAYLTKKDYWSTLTPSYPCDYGRKRTQQLIDNYNIATPQQLTMVLQHHLQLT